MNFNKAVNTVNHLRKNPESLQETDRKLGSIKHLRFKLYSPSKYLFNAVC